MNLRKLEERDLEAVRRLRNSNRSAFFDQREITAEQQRRWFAGLPAKPVKFYVLEVGQQVIGTVSLTSCDEGIEVGNITLDDNYRGHGHMTSAIGQLMKEKGRYFAKILAENTASQRLFARSGFAETYRTFECTVED